MASWLSTKLLGLRKVYRDGKLLADKPGLNFVGCSVTVDDSNNWIKVQVGDVTFDAEFQSVTAESFELAEDVTESRLQDGQGVAEGGSGWHDDGEGVWENDTLAATLRIPLEVPHGAILESVVVEFLPAGSHTALPANMPTFTIRKATPLSLGDIASIADSLSLIHI